MLDQLTHALPLILSETDGHGHINFLAVPVAAVASFIIGGLWYSPLLFVKPWIRLSGHQPDGKRSALKPMIVSFIMDLIMAIGLTTVIALVEEPELMDGMLVGVGVWATFQATLLASNYSFNGRPKRLWLIDAGYRLVAMAAMGAIIGGWHA
ncbi:MAG: DUF1761 domain-containing protein [Planctomycetes bacterium]|nr:DUF1761 domain-containing protein [Planctomycetota bacterium]